MISLTFADVIIGMAIWLIISLIPQLFIMYSRQGKQFIDYSVIVFRAALGALASTILIYRVLELSPWVTMVGWISLNLASSVQTAYMVHQFRKKHDPRPKVYTD